MPQASAYDRAGAGTRNSAQGFEMCFVARMVKAELNAAMLDPLLARPRIA